MQRSRNAYNWLDAELQAHKKKPKAMKVKKQAMKSIGKKAASPMKAMKAKKQRV